jgi:hypothetical protein
MKLSFSVPLIAPELRTRGPSRFAARPLEDVSSVEPSDLEARLALAEAERGETLFDVLREIVEANSDVRLLLS